MPNRKMSQKKKKKEMKRIEQLETEQRLQILREMYHDYKRSQPDNL